VERIVRAVAVGLATGLFVVAAIEAMVLLKRPGDTVFSFLRRGLLMVSLLMFATGAGIVVASVAVWTAIVPLPVSISLVALGGAGAMALWKRRSPSRPALRARDLPRPRPQLESDHPAARAAAGAQEPQAQRGSPRRRLSGWGLLRAAGQNRSAWVAKNNFRESQRP